MPHPGTSQETLQILEAFARRIDQIPIVMQKESSGYVFNAMLVAFLSAAMQLVANHVASVEDVDRAWMGILHTQVGPFGILDVVGLETAYDISKYWGEVRGDEKEKQNAQFLKQYVDTGKLGVKTGEGFYHYPNPTYQQPGFLQGTTE
jgi:3-hydroxybutyryl-CoA dehydrogenase